MDTYAKNIHESFNNHAQAPKFYCSTNPYLPLFGYAFILHIAAQLVELTHRSSIPDSEKSQILFQQARVHSFLRTQKNSYISLEM